MKAKKVIDFASEVIGVTGSMGKTTTKQSISFLLSDKYRICSDAGGYNTPIGLLLTLLDEKSGFSSLKSWFQVIYNVWTKTLPSPEKIVLEYGVDRKGDMDELLDIVSPTLSIFTGVYPIHIDEELGQFKNESEIFEEKSKLIRSLKSAQIAMLNASYPPFQKLSEEIDAQVVWYGEKEKSQMGQKGIFVEDIIQDKNGTSFTCCIEDISFSLFVPSFGTFLPSVLCPAIYIAYISGVTIEEIQAKLRKFIPPAGRGRIFKGKNNTMIWDHSYNASGVNEIIKEVSVLPFTRRIGILGQINEQGSKSHLSHRQMGEISKDVFDIVFFIGKKEYFESFLSTYSDDKKSSVLYFKNSFLASKKIKEVLHKNDFILCKGSQGGVFLETVVESILENSSDRDFLCRRGDDWDSIRQKVFEQ